MSRMKRLTALALAAFLGFTATVSDPVMAAAVTTEQGTDVSMGETEQTSQTKDAATEQNSVADNTQDTQTVNVETAEDVQDVNAETAPDTQTVNTETAEDAQTVDADASAGLVNYLVVDQPQISTPGTQSILVGIGDGSMPLQKAQLTYQNRETGEVYQTEASQLLDDFARFQMEFASADRTGIYDLVRIAYTAGEQSFETAFSEMGIDAAFGVNTAPDTQPDDLMLSDEETEALAEDTAMQVVNLDPNTEATQEQIADALDDAGCEPVSSLTDGSVVSSARGASVDATGMTSLIVVLDPGHGGNDGGAQANGIVEKVVNLKIAQYCKAELEQYSGVTVYMTRSDDTYLTLAQRAQIAVDRHANVFICLHNNSSTSSAPSGANVYYPNGNYNAACGATGQALANIIESKLTDLGLASGGIHIRNSENQTKYPDGSLADYYGVIKRCKENGIPALIVEHAFVSNAGDASRYLSSDDQLKKLGVADATGIAEYYGLTKGIGFSSIQSGSSTTMNLTWTAQSGVTGYCIYRSTSSGSGFSKVATIQSAETTSWKDTGLEPGKTYYYKIRTYTTKNGKNSYGSYSAVASGTTLAQPVISSIKSKNSRQLVISWTANSAAINYEIYRSTTRNGTYSRITTVNGINQYSYTDSNVVAGKKYYYKIRAVGQVDNTTVYSDYSEEVPARTAKQPSKLSVISQDSNTLRISWKGSKYASGYIIKRADSPNGSYKKVGSVSGGTTTSYDDGTVAVNRNYYYKVQAYNYNGGTKGYSDISNWSYSKTLKKVSVAKIAGDAADTMTVTWKRVEGAGRYQIYRSTKKDSGYKRIKSVSASKTSYKDSGLTPGIAYYYKVRATNKLAGVKGYGSFSTPHKVYSGKNPQITLEGTAASKIRVSWEKVNGASGYTVYRSSSSRGTYKKIASVSASKLSCTDRNLKMTSKYYYKVEVKMKGYKTNGTSGKGKAVSGYPARATVITQAGINAAGQLELQWNTISGASGYEIYRSSQTDGVYSRIAVIQGADVSTYADTTAEAAVVYYYKIRPTAVYGGATIYGNYSAPAEGSLLAPPAGVSVTPVSQNQLNVSWSAAANAAGYIIWRSTELNGTYTQAAAVASSQTSWQDTTVTSGVTYYYKIQTVDAGNRVSNFSSTASGCAVAKPQIVSTSWNGNGLNISWTSMEQGMSGFEVYRSCGSDPAIEYKIASTDGTSYQDATAQTSQVYYYRVRTYRKTKSGKNTKTVYGVFSDAYSTNSSDYRIMGASQVTPQRMAAMYRASGKKYPASVYRSKGAADLDSFCKIVYEECCTEGVRPEVLFAQICHETAYLQFGGQVKAEQCNFGGLGATDDGAAGGIFPDVRTGIRAQVQHMKAYASTDPLKQTCVDSRFGYVTRGKAQFVQQLGKGNWATDTAYDRKLMIYISKI